MKHFYLAFCLIILTVKIAFGQANSDTIGARILVVNGGIYEFSPPFQDYVTLSVYDPATRTYSLAGQINAQSVTDAIRYQNTVYISTENGLYSFNATTLAPITGNGNVKGLRKLAHAGGKIWATRGFGSLPGEALLYAFDPVSLSKTDSVNGIADEAEHIIVSGGTAYVAIPGNYLSDTGSIAEVNLQTKQVVRTVRLGRQGKGLGKLVLQGSLLYWYATGGFGATTGYGGYGSWPAITSSTQSGIVGNAIKLLPGSNGAGIGQLYTQGLGVAQLAAGTSPVYELVRSPIAAVGYSRVGSNTHLYGTSQSYSSPGQLYIVSGAVTSPQIDSTIIGVSPEAMVDIPSSLTALSPSFRRNPFFVYPQPGIDQIEIYCEGQSLLGGHVSIINTQGQEVTMPIVGGRTCVNQLSTGIYLIRYKHFTARFVKQ